MPMRVFISVLAITVGLAQPALAQSSAPRPPAASTVEIEKGISEAARSLEPLSRVMAIMGPSLSRAMQAAGPGISRAVEKAQPSLQRAMRTAQPQIDAMGSNVDASVARAPTAGMPTGGELARGLQTAAASLESLSRMMGSVAPDLGKAYDAAAPELRRALAEARPALGEAMKAAEPELRRLQPNIIPAVEQDLLSDSKA